MSEALLPHITPGDSYPLLFTFLVKSVPLDVTGWTVRVMVKKDESDADNQALANVTVTGVGAEAVTGVIRALIPPATTRAFPQGEYVHIQARRSTPQGDVRTLRIDRLLCLKTVIDDD